jgi:Uma2 family endonuclease
MAAIPLENEIFYPESDGEPMAETEVHLFETIYAIEALRQRFAEADDVYVGGNLFFYYQAGVPSAVVAPDTFVVQGVPKLPPRRKYVLWEEKKVPCFVLELTSDSTRGVDVGKKRQLYERLGIQEYFLFDPLGDYLKPRLQGHRLVKRQYQPLQPGPDGSLASESLGLTFRPEEEHLRLLNTLTGEPLLRHEEEVAVRKRAEALAAEEAEARRLAEERVVAAEKRIVAAEKRIVAAEGRAAAEAEARRQLEERLRALEEENARLRQRPQTSVSG